MILIAHSSVARGPSGGPEAFGSSDGFAGEPKARGRRAGQVENRADGGYWKCVSHGESVRDSVYCIFDIHM